MTGRDPPPSSIRLLWIGNHGPSGPEHAVRLLPPLLEILPDAELTISGSEADRSEALHLANDLRIADRVAISDPTTGIEWLLRSTTLLLVTDDPDEARAAIDMAIVYGLPVIDCSPDPDEAARARRGGSGPYTVLARKVAQLLHDRTARAADADEAALAASQPDAYEGGLLPPLTRGTDARRAVKKQAPRASAGDRSLQAIAAPRSVPDRIVRLGAGLFDRVPRTTFAPIRTLDLSTLGLGDTLMAWAGLHALLHGGYRPVAPGCTMYVQGALVRLGAALFAGHGLQVLPATSGGTAEMASPILTPQSPRTWRELYRGLAGPDWRVNCFPAVDAQKPALRADYRYDPWERFCLGLTERLHHHRGGWQAAPAEYVGFRIWMPVARRLELFPLAFLALFKQSLPHLRAEMRAFVEALGRSQPPAAAITVFPSGRSYQAFPADFCARLQDRLQPGRLDFYVPADDPWIDAYRDAGLAMIHLDQIEDLLWILLSTPKLITTDSFASHAAQLLRDDFVLVLTRDIRENVLHPGANPTIVTNHPRCAPCHYVPRVDLTSCPARYDRCIAFENDAFLDRVARTVAHDADLRVSQ